MSTTSCEARNYSLWTFGRKHLVHSILLNWMMINWTSSRTSEVAIPPKIRKLAMSKATVNWTKSSRRGTTTMRLVHSLVFTLKNVYYYSIVCLTYFEVLDLVCKFPSLRCPVLSCFHHHPISSFSIHAA